MCGRYTLSVEVRDLLELLPGLSLPETLPKRYNVAPTQEAAVVLNDGTRSVAMLRWGLVPSWAQDAKIGSRLINARAETLAQKPSFRTPLRQRRCLVLADGFYEWRKDAGGGKTPMRIVRRDRRPFAMAGLWDSWRDAEGRALRTFTIVTTAANEAVAPLHDRMPAILRDGALEAWIDPAARPPETLLPLLEPIDPALLESYEVSRTVNSPANDDPGCIAAHSTGSGTL